LVRQVVDDERLIEEAMKLAQRLAEGPTRALVATCRDVQSEIRQSAHALEGRSAFVEKRKARFSGR
jgi:2-(1,2-epoxy-1,2-dihydrophenyl)acetyl-CoA isomerase